LLLGVTLNEPHNEISSTFHLVIVFLALLLGNINYLVKRHPVEVVSVFSKSRKYHRLIIADERRPSLITSLVFKLSIDPLILQNIINFLYHFILLQFIILYIIFSLHKIQLLSIYYVSRQSFSLIRLQFYLFEYLTWAFFLLLFHLRITNRIFAWLIWLTLFTNTD